MKGFLLKYKLNFLLSLLYIPLSPIPITEQKPSSLSVTKVLVLSTPVPVPSPHSHSTSSSSSSNRGTISSVSFLCSAWKTLLVPSTLASRKPSVNGEPALAPRRESPHIRCYSFSLQGKVHAIKSSNDSMKLYQNCVLSSVENLVFHRTHQMMVMHLFTWQVHG